MTTGLLQLLKVKRLPSSPPYIFRSSFGLPLEENMDAPLLKGTGQGFCREKTVILFPDANAYDLWSERASLLESVAGCSVIVSDTLERNAAAEEKKAGLDIADFLLKNTDETGLALTDHAYPAMWDFNLYNYKINEDG
jgi:hypothetical protein